MKWIMLVRFELRSVEVERNLLKKMDFLSGDSMLGLELIKCND